MKPVMWNFMIIPCVCGLKPVMRYFMNILCVWYETCNVVLYEHTVCGMKPVTW